MGRPSGHINQRLANLVIDEKFPIWDKNDFRTYKKIYPTSKTWILFESKFDAPIPQQLTLSIEPKINLIDNQKQQSFTPAPRNITPVPSNITPGLANAFGSISFIHQLTIQVLLSVPLAPCLLAEHNHGKPEMHLKQNKNSNSQLSASGQKKIQRLSEKNVFKVVTPEKVPSSSQIFDFYFVDKLKDLCIDKAYEKSRPVMYAYNDEEKNLVLMHSLKIPGVSQSISSYLAAII